MYLYTFVYRFLPLRLFTGLQIFILTSQFPKHVHYIVLDSCITGNSLLSLFITHDANKNNNSVVSVKIIALYPHYFRFPHSPFLYLLAPHAALLGSLLNKCLPSIFKEQNVFQKINSLTILQHFFYEYLLFSKTMYCIHITDFKRWVQVFKGSEM